MSSIINSIMLWAFGNESYGVIREVIAGDTLKFIDMATEKEYTIKLYNIETPKKGQEYHNRAKKLVETILIKGEKRILVKVIVREVVDETAYVDLYYSTDRSRKTDGSRYLLQSTLVTKGYAFVRNKELSKELYLLQEYARANKKGAWAIQGYVCPWNFKKEDEIRILVRK